MEIYEYQSEVIHVIPQGDPTLIFGISLGTIRRFVARMLSQIRNFLRHQVLRGIILASKRNISFSVGPAW